MYTIQGTLEYMKNITFSAKEEYIEKARQVAAQKHRTLNELFREWLKDLNSQSGDEATADKLQTLWSQTNYLKVGKKLSRDELHER